MYRTCYPVPGCTLKEYLILFLRLVVFGLCSETFCPWLSFLCYHGPEFLIPGYLVFGYLGPANLPLNIITEATLLLTSGLVSATLLPATLSLLPCPRLHCLRTLSLGYLVSATLPMATLYLLPHP
jgi:hypothetical protein